VSEINIGKYGFIRVLILGKAIEEAQVVPGLAKFILSSLDQR